MLYWDSFCPYRERCYSNAFVYLKCIFFFYFLSTIVLIKNNDGLGKVEVEMKRGKKQK